MPIKSTVLCALLIFLVSCRIAPVLKAEEPSLENKVWFLEKIRKKEVRYSEDQEEITILFNLEAGMFNGASGCNRYFGKFSSQKNSMMMVDLISSTKLACFQELMDLESIYLNVLKGVNTYAIENSKLYLLQGDQVVLTYSLESPKK